MLILFLKHLYLDNLWEIKKDFNRQVIRIAHVRVHSLSMLITKVLLSFKLHCAANFFSNDDHDDDGISLLRIRMYTCIKRKLCSLCYTTPSNPPSFHQSLSWVIITIKFRTHSWQAKMHCSGMSSRCTTLLLVDYMTPKPCIMIKKHAILKYAVQFMLFYKLIASLFLEERRNDKWNSKLQFFTHWHTFCIVARYQPPRW